jgi:transposase
MPWKKHTPEQIITLLRGIEAKIAKGKSISEACKESKVNTKTHYRWRRMCLFRGVSKPDLIRQLKPSSRTLQRILGTSKCANLDLTHRLKTREFHFKESNHNVSSRLFRDLEENRRLRIKERQLFLSMLRFALGYVSYDELRRHLRNRLPPAEITALCARMTDKSHRKRVRALTIIFSLYGVSKKSKADGLWCHVRTVKRCLQAFRRSGVEGVFPRNRRVVKWSDPKYRESLFCILHSPPREHGFNRTTWRIEDLANVMARREMPIGRNRVSAFIKEAGYRYMKARKVLTSNDPNYREKVDHIHRVLSTLKKSERFFSIDEFGPFAIKQQGGRRLVSPGEYPTIPQFQISKGCLIVTAALELSKNQVTHFYSSGKNTNEMIKLLEVLQGQYRDCTRLYFSWDAAGWHASKRFLRRVEEINSPKYRREHITPIVKLVPLPARAQFLNVIESIFSGMAASVIHNSNYANVDEAKAAIDRYFADRNLHFQQNPKRAGKKIWGKELVNSAFKEGQNCKSPDYR